MSLRLLKLIALFCVAFNLRVAMACIGPVVDYLRADLHMNRAQLGLLSTLPVLCMSLFAPFARRVSAARGHEAAILFATLTIATAALVRSVAGAWLMLLSAFAAGVGIAIAGTLLNTFVKQHFPDRTMTASGLYSAALCLGAALAAGFTAPITQLTHGSWHTALAIWSIPGFVGAALWWLMLKREPIVASAVNGVAAPIALPWRNGTARLVTLFFGLQSITFYVVLAWLAPMYVELGWSAQRAGALLSYWISAQVVFILILSRLAARSHDRRPWIVACSIAAAAATTGFALAPLSAWWLWVILMGFASGGWFPLAMTLPLDYGRTPSESGDWTAMMLFGGYLISAGSPSLAGWARDLGATYPQVFLSLAVISVIVGLLSLCLRPRSGPG